MTHQTEAEREEFEAAYVAEKLRIIRSEGSADGEKAIRAVMLRRNANGDYDNSLEAHFAWWAWQAAPRTPAAPVPQEPAAAQSRFAAQNQPWRECSIEHARWVMEKPEEWMGYEARYLYAESAALQPAEPEKCAACQSLETGGVSTKQCTVAKPVKLPLTEAQVFDLSNGTLPGKGHQLIHESAPDYAAMCDTDPGARWILSDVYPENSLAFARAIERAHGITPTHGL